MADIPLISIIVPVYNVEHYIKDCLQSVMRQKYDGEIECIIVDDCGTDSSMNVAEQIIRGYNGNVFFRILRHENNRGLSAARNTGTLAARGEYIYYLDSDDYISDDCISTLTAPLVESLYDIVIGNFEILGNDWGIPKLLVEEGAYKDMILSMYCTGQIYMMAWGKLYKKSFLKNNNLYFKEGILHEDDHMSFRAFAASESIYVSQRKTYYYIVRESGIMNMNHYTVRNRDGYAETLLMIADYIQGHNGVKNEIHEWLNNRYLRKVAMISDEQQVSFLEIYIDLRKRYSYPYIEQVTGYSIGIGRCIFRVHYLFGIYVGYLYFKLLRKCFGCSHI